MSKSKEVLNKILRDGEVTKEELPKILKEYPKLFRFIKNPDELVKTIAVYIDGSNIRYIERPEPYLQSIAIDQDPKNLTYIYDPAYSKAYKTLDQNPHLVCEADPNVRRLDWCQKLYINRHPRFLEYFEEISEENQLILVEKRPNLIQLIDNPSSEVIMKAVAASATYAILKYVDEVPRDIINKALKKNINNLLYINNPSESDIEKFIAEYPEKYLEIYDKIPGSDKKLRQLDAALMNRRKELYSNFKDMETFIRTYPIMIAIKDGLQSQQLLDIAFKLEPRLALFIRRGSFGYQSEVIMFDPLLLRYIKDPLPDVRTLAVSLNPQSIQYISYPSETEQLVAVSKDYSALAHIKLPLDRTIATALNNSPAALELIDNPEESLVMRCMKRAPASIMYVKHQTEKMQRYILHNKPELAIYFNEMSSRIRVDAIKSNPELLELPQFRRLSKQERNDILEFNPSLILDIDPIDDIMITVK